jgi:2-dehydro-3-deoxy-D-arabinonate dehydratase
MSPRVCRFETSGRSEVGLLSAHGTVTPTGVGSMTELLQLRLPRIREIIDGAAARPDQGTPDRLLAPTDRQEVWAAGVTYERSREARVAESGLVDVYTRAYNADRPELFFKAPAERVVPPGRPGRLRGDSRWDACEPELAVVANAHAEIVGYTIANDLCSRSIEAENPLYLPQAKTYTDSCVLGAGWTPSWVVGDPRAGTMSMRLLRNGNTLYEGATPLSRLRRTPEDLVRWLFRALDFPCGVFLLTGTGLVAPDAVHLDDGDEVVICAAALGELRHMLYHQ